MRPCASIGRGNGFTIVELMAAIGITLILSSLTLSAVYSAKRKAHTAQCAHNLRQHGVALQGFVNQTGTYPLQMNTSRKDGNFPDHSATWMASLFPANLNEFDGNDNHGVFNCPSVKRPRAFPTDQGFADFGYNSAGFRGRPIDEPLGIGGRGSKEDQFAPPVKESEVRFPSRLLAIGDGLNGWNKVIEDGVATVGRIPGAQDRAGSTKRSQKRHKGTASFVFCDGHVEALMLSTLFASTAEGALALWNRDGKAHSERLNK
jgi:prepilin-type processing-associated H-X9-DG protein